MEESRSLFQRNKDRNKLWHTFFTFQFLHSHMDIYFLQQMGHSSLTITSLETNEDKNYKATFFYQPQIFFEKFFYCKKLWFLL